MIDIQSEILHETYRLFKFFMMKAATFIRLIGWIIWEVVTREVYKKPAFAKGHGKTVRTVINFLVENVSKHSNILDNCSFGICVLVWSTVFPLKDRILYLVILFIYYCCNLHNPDWFVPIIVAVFVKTNGYLRLLFGVILIFVGVNL